MRGPDNESEGMENVQFFMRIALLLVSILGPTLAGSEEGVLTDLDVATGYYRPLAQEGSPYAQLALGEAYLEGAAVPQNLIEAYAWFSVAAAQGVIEAEAERDRVFARIPDKDQREARALAKSYREAFIPRGIE